MAEAVRLFTAVAHSQRQVCRSAGYSQQRGLLHQTSRRWNPPNNVSKVFTLFCFFSVYHMRAAVHMFPVPREARVEVVHTYQTQGNAGSKYNDFLSLF